MNSTLGRELHEFQDYGVSSIIAIRYRITRVMIHEFMSHDSRFSMLTVAKYVKVQDSFSSVFLCLQFARLASTEVMATQI